MQTIAKLAGVDVPDGTRMILIKARSIGKDEPLCREKMCPVMITASYDTFENAVKLAQTDLDCEGTPLPCIATIWSISSTLARS